MKHHKILISACLLGQKVRYDGLDSYCEHPILKIWQQEKRLIALCPEMAGGLPTPRPACEIVGHGGGEAVIEDKAKVLTKVGADYSQAFVQGAQTALVLAKRHHIVMAILKARSPSCGNQQIYDGTFQSEVIDGMGVTAALLIQNGIKVFNETQIDEAVNYLCQAAKNQSDVII